MINDDNNLLIFYNSILNEIYYYNYFDIYSIYTSDFVKIHYNNMYVFYLSIENSLSINGFSNFNYLKILYLDSIKNSYKNLSEIRRYSLL
jgi:hypothetical protein